MVRKKRVRSSRFKKTFITALKSINPDWEGKVLDALQTNPRLQVGLAILETGSNLWVSKFKLMRKSLTKIKLQQILNLKTTFPPVQTKITWSNLNLKQNEIGHQTNAKILTRRTFMTTLKRSLTQNSNYRTTNNSVTCYIVFTIRSQQTSTGITYTN